MVCFSSLASCDAARSTVGTTTAQAVPNQPSFIVNVGERVNIYIHAHQESWGLFMGDRAATGVQTVPGAVFVYLTAGDDTRNATYWGTRELAARAAVDAVTPSGIWACEQRTINGHSIHRCTKGGIVSYDMRLPNCPLSGEGQGGRTCLGDLRDGAPSLSAIDASTTYTSWADLAATVRGVIELESSNQTAPFVDVHAPEYDRALNPRGHPDNYATGDLVRTAVTGRGWNLSWYVDYDALTRPVNLNQAAHDMKEAAFLAYDFYMSTRGFGANRFEPEYQSWLWRTYFRSEVSVPVPPPAAPSNLAAQTFSSSRVDLTWTDNATSETGYYVERAPDNAGVAGTYVQITSLAANATSYSSLGLAPGTTFWFRVRAFNASNSSPYSNEISALTLQVPATPTNLQGQAISTTRIDLTWTDNATNETAYNVERAPDNAGAAGTFAQIASLAAGATSYSNTGLGANTRYWYRVRAANATDVSAYSSSLSVTTLQGPAAPSNLVAQAASATQINLTWTDNTTTETGFTVERAPDNAGAAGTFAAIATLTANTTSYNDGSLTQNTRYWYRVRAFTAADVSAYSASANATTPFLPPAAPTNLQAQAMSSSRIDLSWTDNANNESGFLVERALDNAGVPGSFLQIASLGANVVGYSSTGLSPSTKYWHRVRSFNSAQNSAYTSSVSATTLSPPTQRTDVFIHAHQDDWHLFMSDRANTSLQVATKVVFVYTTAGDGGMNATWWQTRELAARAGIDALLAGGTWTCANQTINSHPIHRCVKGKAVSYDMRLPSCAMNEVGYFGRGCISDLRDGSRATLVPLDASTTYTSWSDLYTTVRGIIDFESNNGSAPLVEVHSPEYDRALNPRGHVDHYATADLVRQSVTTRSYNQSWYVDYDTKNRAVNLSQAMHDIKESAFYAYDFYMSTRGLGANRFEAEYQAWLWRTYLRTVTP